MRHRKVGIAAVLITLCLNLLGCSAKQKEVVETSHIHEYAEATCLEPQKCNGCEQTLGAALGHTTDLGKCTRCGETFGKEYADIMKEMNKHTQNINTKTTPALEYLSNLTSVGLNSSYGEMAYDHFQDVYTELEAIESLCGDYEIFSDLKIYANKVKRNLPKNYNTGEYEGAIAMLNDAKTFAEAMEDMVSEMADIANELSDILE